LHEGRFKLPTQPEDQLDELLPNDWFADHPGAIRKKTAEADIFLESFPGVVYDIATKKIEQNTTWHYHKSTGCR